MACFHSCTVYAYHQTHLSFSSIPRRPSYACTLEQMAGENNETYISHVFCHKVMGNIKCILESLRMNKSVHQKPACKCNTLISVSIRLLLSLTQLLDVFSLGDNQWESNEGKKLWKTLDCRTYICTWWAWGPGHSRVYTCTCSCQWCSDSFHSDTRHAAGTHLNLWINKKKIKTQSIQRFLKGFLKIAN